MKFFANYIIAFFSTFIIQACRSVITEENSPIYEVIEDYTVWESVDSTFAAYAYTDYSGDIAIKKIAKDTTLSILTKVPVVVVHVKPPKELLAKWTGKPYNRSAEIFVCMLSLILNVLAVFLVNNKLYKIVSISFTTLAVIFISSYENQVHKALHRISEANTVWLTEKEYLQRVKTDPFLQKFWETKYENREILLSNK